MDQEEEDLKLALRLSMQQHESPEAKRSKAEESSDLRPVEEESAEARIRRKQRELMAAAAERRMVALKSVAGAPVKDVKMKGVEAEEEGKGVKDVKMKGVEAEEEGKGVKDVKMKGVKAEDEGKVVKIKGVEAMDEGEGVKDAKMKGVEAMDEGEGVKDAKMKGVEADDERKGVGGEVKPLISGVNLLPKEDGEVSETISGENLLLPEAEKLFGMIFGEWVSPEVLAQWSNQGVRFSADPETSMGLVQHEGGPCGVLAAIQAFVLKHLLFPLDESVSVGPNSSKSLTMRSRLQSESVGSEVLSSVSDERRSRALVRSMVEILFLCGSNERAVIATVNIVDSVKGAEDEEIVKLLQGISLESGHDLHNYLRVSTFASRSSALQKLADMLPLLRSRLGALLFLISALLSRGLDNVQDDRDDPDLPLVTAPFGHASQEIVNLLLSGRAVANVFDGNMDLGGGMSVKGISTTVEVGFLTLLESLNFCKVGQNLKSPKWPIWVVGSESHYTVLFALDIKVQEENELESRESHIRRAFDARDQSGGGGFISVESFREVLRETNINLPSLKIENLSNTGFIVWSEFWQAILDLDKSQGGVKDSTGLLGKKVFNLYHFNGIAKSFPGSENPIQRPRLTKVRVSVPPRWTPEEYMADVPVVSDPNEVTSGLKKPSDELKSQPAQHAQLVDCIRTRWPRSVCNWEGDSPSIV